MKVELVWPFPVHQRLQIDVPITIKRLPMAATKRSVRRVEIEYFGSTLVDQHWFLSFSSTIWFFKVTSQLVDGRMLVYRSSGEGNLELALDAVYAQATQACFEFLYVEAQNQLVNATA